MEGQVRDKDDKKASLQAAIEDAWEKRRRDPPRPGRHVCRYKIEIETSNPIHAYSVSINPPAP